MTDKTDETIDLNRVRWMEAKLLHAQAILQQIAVLRRGNALAGVPEGWSDKGHAAAEGLALGWLTDMPDGLKGTDITRITADDGHAHPIYGTGGTPDAD